MQTNRPLVSLLTATLSPRSRKRAAILALLGFALAAAACAQRLGPLTPIDRVHFQVGVTRKTDVANTLGLPTSRSVDEDYEYWNYPDGPALSSIDIPILTGTSPTTPIVYTETVDVGEQQQTALVCIFKRDGVLSSVRDLRGAR